ncbi:B12-binding domain-containing radical SAM protein [Bradyrhizobium sp. AUGA SZCCT0222]|uniref:B12-binding domain-containing radical SAM protein n=1 Tax=Bradyrhizobium sp. AUGA SZCCT0222 TaxID=2807668 RepID=UPI001BA8A925|nr:radical SAM protein [Bradyrhizobium sp. AUGA SZCCT0222]MBR1271940.1 B12-binding domain-containing radical SAM protein [Bradyrhizobium sp. AUGA SZCCT0222]
MLKLASTTLHHLLNSANASPAQPEPLLSRSYDKPRLLFLHPKTLVDSWPFTVDTLGEIVKAPSAVYPILASVVSDLPLQIEMFDGYVTRESFVNYKRRLRQADVIAISMMSPLKALDTELTIRLAKALNPNVVIILGGNHASAFPERWIECGVDFVVVGEGEVAFRELMQAIVSRSSTFNHLPNLVYRDHGRAKATGVKAPKIDLNRVPVPRWDLFDLRPYGLGLQSGGLTAAVEVSRGCPHRCDFCNINTFWNYRQDYKSVERVCDELAKLHGLGVREFIFTDDNFAQDHRHTKRLFEEMIRRDLRMRFGSFMRGDTVNRNPELVELAARAGLSFCLMGIETLDPEWLKSHRKGVRADDAVSMYKNVYGVLRRNGVFVIGLFITPPEAANGQVSGRGADGVVCDAHYTADLVATKGSALFIDLSKRGAVGKDMFYHDWNLSSIKLPDGRSQRSQTLLGSLRVWNTFAITTALIGPPLLRRFRWRNVGVLAERVLCTSWADIRRFRMAKDESLPLGLRQHQIVNSVVAPGSVQRLIKARWFKSPLSLRNSIWSAQLKQRTLIAQPVEGGPFRESFHATDRSAEEVQESSSSI